MSMLTDECGRKKKHVCVCTFARNKGKSKQDRERSVDTLASQESIQKPGSRPSACPLSLSLTPADGLRGEISSDSPRPFLLRGLGRGLCLFLPTPETRHRLTPEQPGVLGLVSTHSSTLPDGCWVATASLNKQNQDLRRFLPLEHQSRKALPYLSYFFIV